MSSLMGVSASRGALLEVRKQLQFIKKSTQILEMKRDKVASELNRLLPLLKGREEIESRFTEVYKKFVKVLVDQGYEEFRSSSMVVPKVETRLQRRLIMGIEEYDVELVSPPNVEAIPNPAIKELAIEFHKVFMDLLEMSVVENKIEALAYDLMNTARKVNALQKIIIPSYEELIKYIEERIMEEELSEFVRTKFIVERREK